MQLREIISRNVHAAAATDTARSAAELMRRHSIGAVPVFENQQLCGIITDRDITTGCVAAGHNPAECSVREHMSADPVTIGLDASVDEALAAMASEQVRRLVVMSDTAVAGVVSLGDLAVYEPGSPTVARALAEISQPIRVPTA